MGTSEFPLHLDLGRENNPQTIKEWCMAINDWARRKGWWDDRDKNYHPELIPSDQKIMLMVTELAEAYEEIRNHHADHEIYYNENDKPEGVPIELADCVIRIMDFCAARGINLQEALEIKMAYNEKRPYRHGGKAS